MKLKELIKKFGIGILGFSLSVGSVATPITTFASGINERSEDTVVGEDGITYVILSDGTLVPASVNGGTLTVSQPKSAATANQSISNAASSAASDKKSSSTSTSASASVESTNNSDVEKVNDKENTESKSENSGTGKSGSKDADGKNDDGGEEDSTSEKEVNGTNNDGKTESPSSEVTEKKEADGDDDKTSASSDGTTTSAATGASEAEEGSTEKASSAKTDDPAVPEENDNKDITKSEGTKSNESSEKDAANESNNNDIKLDDTVNGEHGPWEDSDIDSSDGETVPKPDDNTFGDLDTKSSDADTFETEADSASEIIEAIDETSSGITGLGNGFTVPGIILDDFRFYKVDKVYAFAKGDVKVYDSMDTTAAVVGTMKEKDIAFILCENSKKTWAYIESGDVRGFVQEFSLYKDTDADKILDEYKKGITEADKAVDDVEADADNESSEADGSEDNSTSSPGRLGERARDANSQNGHDSGDKDKNDSNSDDDSDTADALNADGASSDDAMDISENIVESSLKSKEEEGKSSDSSTNDNAEKAQMNNSNSTANDDADPDQAVKVPSGDNSSDANSNISVNKHLVSDGIDFTGHIAIGTVEKSNNKAFSYLRMTTQDVVVDKIYAIPSGSAEVEIKEEKNSDSRTVGKIPVDGLAYIIADKDSDWIYVEAGDARGFVPKDSINSGDSIQREVSNKGEDKYAEGLKTVDPSENKALYYTITSIKEGSSSSGSAQGTAIVEFASKFAGNRYVWGGTSLTNGADCSGFVQSVYKQFGYSLPRVAADQANVGTKISVSDAQPGDLIFYRNSSGIHHVVIYAGNGKTIEARSSRAGIGSWNVNYKEACWAVRILPENGQSGSDNNDSESSTKTGTLITPPENLSNVYTYMGWQCITNTGSKQYRLMKESGMPFDSEGFGVINGRYVIACASTYGDVGDMVDFYMEDGTILPCIIGDIKSSSDAGYSVWGHKNGKNAIEFVVDKRTWYSGSHGVHANPGTVMCHSEWKQYVSKAINIGSYFG